MTATTETAASSFQPRYLLPLGMVFAVTLVISNTLAAKIVQLGPFSVAGGIVCFPLTYVLADVAVEVYGYARSRQVIWTGVACLILMSACYTIGAYLTPAPFWEGQESWVQFFTMSPRIVAGSITAYLCGEFVNAYIMSRMKVATAGRHFGARAILSTIAGEALDSGVFNFVAFAGVFGWNELWVIALSGFLLKTGYEVAIVPITYRCAVWLKRLEGHDHFDVDLESYNPFKAWNR